MKCSFFSGNRYSCTLGFSNRKGAKALQYLVSLVAKRRLTNPRPMHAAATVAAGKTALSVNYRTRNNKLPPNLYTLSGDFDFTTNKLLKVVLFNQYISSRAIIHSSDFLHLPIENNYDFANHGNRKPHTQPRVSAAKFAMTKNWTKAKPHIEHYYLARERQLKEVRELMIKEHGFKAS